MKVLFVGDSRKMRGGVSTVIKTIEKSSIWEKYNCNWLETQINATKIIKFWYLIKGYLKGVYMIPQYNIIHFQTEPQKGTQTLFFFFLYAKLLKKKIIVQYHVGNQLEKCAFLWRFKFWLKYADKTLFLGDTWVKQMKNLIPNINNANYLYNPVSVQHKQCTPHKYFLFAALFRANKGCDILIKAFAKIAHKYPDWKIVLCGNGDYKPEIDRLIKDYNLFQQVELPGWIQDDQKHKYYQNAYAYCMCSYLEGLPMSVLEAMSYGVPIITTPVGCLQEFLVDKESALFFDYGNIDELATALETLIENKSLRTKIAENGYILAKEKFDTDVICKRLSKIYDNL